MTNRVLAVLLAVLTWSQAAQANDWSAGVTYRYDGAGNIKEIGTDRHVYDWAGRIVQSDTNGVRRTFQYDAYGNRTRCLQAGGTDCQYSWTIDPDTNRIGPAHATYDAAGNVIQFDGHSYGYDAFNMQTRDTQGSQVVAEYIYTASDERIAVYVPGTGAWRWSLRDASGKVMREMTSRDPAPGSGGTVGTASWSWVKDYIYRDGLLLASRQLESGASTPTTYHYHLDHLGTPRRITDDSGRIVGAHSYHAFGPEPSDGRKDEPMPTRLKYTGHERDGELDYMHARYYDPRMGRFLSVDPGGDVDINQPQSWNKYAYVRNSPVDNIDPTGRCTNSIVCLNYGSNEEMTVTTTPADMGSPWYEAVANAAVGMAAAEETAAYMASAPYTIEGGGLQETFPQMAIAFPAALGAVQSGLTSAAAAGVTNPVPSTLARVIAGEGPYATLGRVGADDVFVTAADDIAGMSARQLGPRLGIPSSDTFTVIQFQTPTSGVASPIFRKIPGFVGRGRTTGWAREFVVPNGPIPVDSVMRIVR